jgi:hypothetical protein
MSEIIKDMPTISLETLLVPSKATTIEYPGMPGFELDVTFLSRETIKNMRKKCVKTKWKNHEPVEDFNEDLFLDLYVEAVIVGWRGLKLSYLETLVPVDLKKMDRDMELPYSKKEALMLMKGSSSLDKFISDFVSDLGNFTSNK